MFKGEKKKMVNVQQIRNIVMGQKDSSELFDQYWGKHGFVKSRKEAGSSVTAPVQRMLHTSNKEALAKYTGSVRKNIGLMVKDAMGSGQVENFTPLVFDPEILSILKQNAPFLETVAMEGQEGFTAVYQRIDTRSDPIGFLSEANSLNLTNAKRGSIGFAKGEQKMKLYVDVAEVADFSQAAAGHYMNVEDTTLGERVALYAQRKEQQILYGNPITDFEGGYLNDGESYPGLSTIYAAQGNEINKSSVDEKFILDIQKEIASIKQKENVSVSDLRIVTSHTFYQVLSSELVPSNMRLQSDSTSANVGVTELRIDGVPVMATHNVDEHFQKEEVKDSDAGDNTFEVSNDYSSLISDGDVITVTDSEGVSVDLTVAENGVDYTSGTNTTEITVTALAASITGQTASIKVGGDKGDVFITNARANRFRALVPFSAVPLAKLGLSDTTALFEFGAFIERTGGNWGRYLKGYDI